MYRVHLLLIFTFVLTLVGCAPSLRAGAPSAWEARNVGLPSHASVTSVLFVDAPEPPGLLLAGVYGAESLYVSRDGGDTWRMAGFRDGGRAGIDGQPVHVLARHADNGLLAGTSSGLYRSDAFDAQGEPIWERIDEWPRMRAVYSVAQTATGESLIAGRWPALLAYDGEAVQFTAPVVDEPGAILSVLALDSGLILAGTDGAGLFLSEDQGATWQGADDIGATFVAGLFAAPWNGSLVLARTRNGLFRSQDRGQSWTPTGEEIEGRPDTLLALPDTDTLLLGMSTGHLYNSQDDGATWQPWGDRAAPTAAHGPGLLRDGLFQTLARVEHNGHVRLWAGTQHGLYVSADDGRTWTFHWDVGTPVLNALAITEDNTLYAGSHDGVYRSSDRGVTWEWAGDGLPPRAVTALTLHPHDTKLLYAGMDGGGLWRGDLETETWTHIGWAGNSIPDVLVDGEDPDRLFVRVAFERIYESAHGEDDSLEWQARWDGMSTVTEVISFAQSNHDADLMFAGGATDFYRSRDRAESWERIGPELAGQSGFFVTVDEDDPQVVYAGATNGPYISRDGGDTWRRWGTGLENRTVTAVARHPRGGACFLCRHQVCRYL